MKIIISFLSAFLACLTVYCQTEARFNYELCRSGNQYIITLKSEKPLPENAREVTVGFFQQQDTLVFETVRSIIEKSIGAEKIEKLTEVRGGNVHIHFSSTGKVLRIQIFMPKEDLEILNEDDLYTLYRNLQKVEIDMSNIQIRRPPIWVEGMDFYWHRFFFLGRRRLP